MGERIPVYINCAVEGDLDERVIIRLLECTDIQCDRMFNAGGKPKLIERLPGYNHSARFRPWVVLIDLNRNSQCAPALRRSLIAKPGKFMTIRVAVRSVEAWLMADRERFSDFLDVPLVKIPESPEELDNPKETLVNIARSSRRKMAREGIVPKHNSGRMTGPAYNSLLSEFVRGGKGGWRPEVASRRSNSLKRCLTSLKRLSRGGGDAD